MTHIRPAARRGPSRRRVVLAAAFLSTVGVVLTVAINANAAEDGFYDAAALNTSCTEEVPDLGQADRCRFEPWTKENFTGDIVRVSGDTVNCTAVNGTKSITWSQSTTEENSIQIAASAELALSDIFKVSITTTYGHSWAYTNTESQTETAPVPAGSIAWIERGAPLQRVTGRMVINYSSRRHGHFEWYTYPVVTSADPEAVGFSTVILRSRPITAEENTRLCGGSVSTQAVADAPAPSQTVLQKAAPASTTVTVRNGDTSVRSGA